MRLGTCALSNPVGRGYHSCEARYLRVATGGKRKLCPVATHLCGRSLNAWVSSPGESHPEALAELYVSLSTHTAPIMEPCRAPICQCANNSGRLREIRAIQCVALRRWRRSFLYFCLAQRARSRSS